MILLHICSLFLIDLMVITFRRVEDIRNFLIYSIVVEVYLWVLSTCKTKNDIVAPACYHSVTDSVWTFHQKVADSRRRSCGCALKLLAWFDVHGLHIFLWRNSRVARVMLAWIDPLFARFVNGLRWTPLCQLHCGSPLHGSCDCCAAGWLAKLFYECFMYMFPLCLDHNYLCVA
jgi:hypothetical protein